MLCWSERCVAHCLLRALVGCDGLGSTAPRLRTALAAYVRACRSPACALAAYVLAEQALIVVQMADVVVETEEGLRLTIELAAQGSADAQSWLGIRYEHGDGVAQNQAEALRLYTQAAEQGDAIVQHSLGRCYMTGNGVDHDEKKAARLFRKAAKQGLAEAQHGLGQCFKLGADVVQDEEEAVKLYWQAVDQGLAAAQFALDNSCWLGKGVPQDQTMAMKLFRQAAEQGFAAAQSQLGHCCMLDVGVAHNIADAARYLRLAADQGDASAQCALGFLCEGQGTNFVRALARLGVCLEKGRGVAQSAALATASYAAAFKLGGADTLFETGVQHLDAVSKVRASESFYLQLTVRDLALAVRLRHAGVVEKLASISSRREVVSASCLGCGATRELRLCSRCRVATFCDGDCVRRMWPAHKPNCQEWLAARAWRSANLRAGRSPNALDAKREASGRGRIHPALAVAARRFASFSPKDLEAYRGKIAADLTGLSAEARAALDKKAKLLEFNKADASYSSVTFPMAPKAGASKEVLAAYTDCMVAEQAWLDEKLSSAKAHLSKIMAAKPGTPGAWSVRS
ncbi:hypothetical protein T492DRAFT_862554 [Pavlovales sp. CCMP2436]|nr:hypothetical protein T492DRAFT_862554 [Pavlovales sp. CCMP2436]